MIRQNSLSRNIVKTSLTKPLSKQTMFSLISSVIKASSAIPNITDMPHPVNMTGEQVAGLIGGSLKVTTIDTAYHKGSCQKETPLPEEIKGGVEREKSISLRAQLRDLQSVKFSVFGITSVFFFCYCSSAK